MGGKRRGSGRSGTYCIVCGEWKANERFSGKGHARHVCKDCARLSPEQQERLMAIDVRRDLSPPLSAEDRDFLEELARTRPNARKKAKRKQRKRTAEERREARRKARQKAGLLSAAEVVHDELWVDDGLDLPF